MKQLFDHYNADGEPCDRWGNVIYADGILPEGGSLRVPLMMMDSMQRVIAQEHKTMNDDYQQGLRDAMADTGQTQYERRTANAWRDGAIPASLEDGYTRGINDACHEAAWAEERRIADVQKDYVTRVTEAWR